jgi:lipopolysaccharide export LptBFGC system permease protein LptF
MIWTLYRYISKDLLINFTLCLTGLTSVLALGGVLVRMRQEGLDVTRILQIFLYLIPVMLTVTLPFAALFSATLVYGRMSSHNEINACRAGGIGVGTLMYPAFALAVITGLASSHMAMYMIPVYTREVELVLRDNIKRVAMSRLRSRGWAEIKGQGASSGRLFADEADPDRDPPVMWGVLFLIERSALDRQVVTAEEVSMDFEPDTDRLLLRLKGTWGTPQDRQLEAGEVTIQMSLPPRIGEKVKYKTLDELLVLQDAPVDDADVRGRLTDLAQLHQVWLFTELLKEKYGRPDRPRVHTFVRPGGPADGSPDPAEGEPPVHYRLSAGGPPRIGNGVAILPEATLEVFREGFDADPSASPVYEFYRADNALLISDVVFASGRNGVRLLLQGCTLVRERGPGGGLREVPVIRKPELRVDGLEMPGKLYNPKALDHVKVLRDMQSWPDELLPEKRADALKSVDDLHRKIQAELHSRFAMGVCCLLFVFLGAGLGVTARTGDYIVALAVSAAPGALTLGVVVMGRRILVDMANPAIGIATIWGGPALLLLANVLLFRQLLRR